MPVAIRKRSWEEHVTHASGLQYSYDDLDLVCCHGVGSEGPWMGAGSSKQGRRTRCASMPEGCHQLPTQDLAQTLEVTASVVCDNTASEQLKLMDSDVKVPVDLSPDDTPVLDPQKNIASDFNQNPHVQQSHMDVKHAGSEQQTENLPPCPAEVNDELSPGGLHGNQALGCYLSESPASEVADGQREHQRPGATVSRMDVHAVIHNDTQLLVAMVIFHFFSLICLFIQREHARLDSMVLLLMKLDQLDQEIENALSATSSMDSTPTLHRRPLQVHTWLSQADPGQGGARKDTLQVRRESPNLLLAHFMTLSALLCKCCQGKVNDAGSQWTEHSNNCLKGNIKNK
uniref:Uncharacterized protein n=1 Tax=Cyclopterus lumpus TaxID=8103 RepID=A0A8C2X5X9_CYCLU